MQKKFSRLQFSYHFLHVHHFTLMQCNGFHFLASVFLFRSINEDDFFGIDGCKGWGSAQNGRNKQDELGTKRQTCKFSD